MKNYKPVKTYPVARFYYKGSHSHPVRRTILIIENTDTQICGYELREGSTVRKLADAPVKSYNKAKIARLNQLRNKLPSRKTTLKRQRIYEFLTVGP